MKYVEGDMFLMAEQGYFNYVIHGCNCQNTMGSGVAKTVRDKYPQAYAADQSTQRGDVGKLGHFTMAYIPPKMTNVAEDGSLIRGFKALTDSFTIINAYTQIFFGATDRPNVDLFALEQVFKGIKLAFDNNPGGVSSFAIPKIGAVRGGGVWEEIEAVIDSVGIIDLTCVLYNGSVNK